MTRYKPKYRLSLGYSMRPGLITQYKCMVLSCMAAYGVNAVRGWLPHSFNKKSRGVSFVDNEYLRRVLEASGFNCFFIVAATNRNIAFVATNNDLFAIVHRSALFI